MQVPLITFIFRVYVIELCSVGEWFLKGFNILPAKFVSLNGLNWPTNPNEQARTIRPNMHSQRDRLKEKGRRSGSKYIKNRVGTIKV